VESGLSVLHKSIQCQFILICEVMFTVNGVNGINGVNGVNGTATKVVGVCMICILTSRRRMLR
jgi:hypothetical protein